MVYLRGKLSCFRVGSFVFRFGSLFEIDADGNGRIYLEYLRSIKRLNSMGFAAPISFMPFELDLKVYFEIINDRKRG
jgi:hypothetical protein